MHWRFSIGSHLLKENIQINVILFVFEDVKIQNTFSYLFIFFLAVQNFKIFKIGLIRTWTAILLQ